MAFFPGLPGWAGTRKLKPIWILLKQETLSGICWAICICLSVGLDYAPYEMDDWTDQGADRRLGCGLWRVQGAVYWVRDQIPLGFMAFSSVCKVWCVINILNFVR